MRITICFTIDREPGAITYNIFRTIEAVAAMKSFDFVGIGGMNIDYILPAENVNKAESRVEPGYELRVDHIEKIENEIKQKGLNQYKIFCGGSAFNTISAIASMKQGFDLAYIGIMGKVENGCNFETELTDKEIDSEHVVRKRSLSCGKCISYNFVDEDRALKTCEQPIARYLAPYLESNRDKIVDYLARAKNIHVTSIFDEPTATEVCKILEIVKTDYPSIKISFDPGYNWIQNMFPFVTGLLSISDIVFLNEKEFKEFNPGEDEYSTANIISKMLKSKSQLLVLKSNYSIKIVTKWKGEPQIEEHKTTSIDNSMIKDHTGAGDVFAAGFLVAQSIPLFRGEFKRSIDLGLNMVKEKLQFYGSSQYKIFFNVVERLAGEHIKPSKPIRHDIFLSYSSKDDKKASNLSLRLKNSGFNVYFARKELKGGDDFSNEIRNALNLSRKLFLLLSKDSLRSEWVLTEWGAAWMLGKTIVPILIDCSREDIPLRLQNLQCVNYDELDNFIARLKDR